LLTNGDALELPVVSDIATLCAIEEKMMYWTSAQAVADACEHANKAGIDADRSRWDEEASSSEGDGIGEGDVFELVFSLPRGNAILATCSVLISHEQS